MAVAFDGTGSAYYTASANQPSTNRNSVQTFGAMVRVDALPEVTAYILGYESTYRPDRRHWSVEPNGDWSGFERETQYGNEYTFDFGSHGADGTWRLLIQRLDGTEVRTYYCDISGTPVLGLDAGQYAGAGQTFDAGQTLKLGRAMDTTDQAVCALADVWRVDAVLTEAQIAEIAAGTPIDQIATPANWWKLADPNDTTDYGTQGNDLIVTGSPSAATGPSFGPIGETVSAAVLFSMGMQDTPSAAARIAARVTESMQAGDAGNDLALARQAVANTVIADDDTQSVVRASSALVDGLAAGEQWATDIAALGQVQAGAGLADQAQAIAAAQAAMTAGTVASDAFVAAIRQAGRSATQDAAAFAESLRVVVESIAAVGSRMALSDAMHPRVQHVVATLNGLYQSDLARAQAVARPALQDTATLAVTITARVQQPSTYAYVTVGSISIISAVSASMEYTPAVTARVTLKPN